MQTWDLNDERGLFITFIFLVWHLPYLNETTWGPAGYRDERWESRTPIGSEKRHQQIIITLWTLQVQLSKKIKNLDENRNRKVSSGAQVMIDDVTMMLCLFELWRWKFYSTRRSPSLFYTLVVSALLQVPTSDNEQQRPFLWNSSVHTRISIRKREPLYEHKESLKIHRYKKTYSCIWESHK